MVVVPKPDGALRVCIDFRQVNMDIVNNVYPMHRINDQLEAMAGSTVFTTLDLTTGYNKLLLHSKFEACDGIFQAGWSVPVEGPPTWNEYGWAVFQRVMDQIMKGLQPWCVAVYIYDITVYSPSLEQHARDLKQVFCQLENALLRFSVGKTYWAKDLILVLEHRVSAAGIEPNPHKVVAVRNMSLPWDVTDVKQLMGMVRFYC